MAFMKDLYYWLHPKPVEPPTTTAATQALADNAVQRAIADLQAAQASVPHVSLLVSKNEDQVARNHFGELVEASMRGRG
jgi:hypothetical protein